MMLLTPLRYRVSVRFARKPIWMPTAPSKLFRIPEHKFYTDEESNQIKTIQRALRHQEESIRQYMMDEFYLPATRAGGLPDSFISHEREQDKTMVDKNNEENARIRILRERAFDELVSKKQDDLLTRKFEREEELLRVGRETDEFIEQQKADTYSFVTEDTIDQLIDKAMEDCVSYEFCIDRSGNKSQKP